MAYKEVFDKDIEVNILGSLEEAPVKKDGQSMEDKQKSQMPENNIFPLYVSVDVKISPKDALALNFHYLPELGIITVKATSPAAYLDLSTIVNLFPGDNGSVIPNLKAKYASEKC